MFKRLTIAVLCSGMLSSCSVAVAPKVKEFTDQFAPGQQMTSGLTAVPASARSDGTLRVLSTTLRMQSPATAPTMADMVVAQYMADKEDVGASVRTLSTTSTSTPAVARAQSLRRENPDEYIRLALQPLTTNATPEQFKLRQFSTLRSSTPSRAPHEPNTNDPPIDIPLAARFVSKIILQGIEPTVAEKTERISVKDFSTLPEFTENMRLAVLTAGPDVAAGGDKAAPNDKNDKLITSSRAALILYAKSYHKGEFINRFGRKLALPEIKNTLTNEAIAGSTEVFIEWLADYLLRTPLYYKKDDAAAQKASEDGKKPKGPNDGKKFCAAKAVPTAARWTRIEQELLVDAKNDDGQKMTSTKCEIVSYGASSIASSVTSWSGGALESIGGFNFGIAVAGMDFSVGDNETLRTLAKTAIETATRRTAQHLLNKAALTLQTQNINDEWQEIFGDEEETAAK